MAQLTWIKLNIDMFDNRKIKQIRKLPGGNDIVLFWVMLLTLAGKCNAQGYILLTESLPYKPEMLATEFDMELNTVKMALEIFEKFNMVETHNEGIKISGWEDHQNLEGMDKIREQNRLRKQRQRSKIKELQAPAQGESCGTENTNHVTSQKSHDMSRDSHDIEVEGEVDKEVDNTTTATTGNEPVDNVDNFIDFFNNNFGHLMTPFEFQILQSYIEDGMQSAVITLALQEAVEKDAREISYIKAILNRWLEHGLKTVEAVMADKRDFKNKKKKKEPNRQQFSSKKESTFNNFEQRSYDYDDLEKKLLGWQK
ncbi:phage replisome organizer N-terminal domain-containing protein [Clostridium carboxidivorans]|uniref:phage replisome organizer N-terminal domain-containing protein n=1 Tax=Clostridium carboxidivorans TaxID=217159 RepID=UPI00069F8194|nr:phage replisome organizer N-terminal domain-containing protein [Clostridium carboxidivorans]